MKVLLTGHLGYVGTVLAPMLGERGHNVTGLDSDLYRACNYGPEPAQVQSLNLDIRDVTADVFEGCEAVVHLAGLSNDPLGELDPHLTSEINHLATVRLARLAIEAGVRRFIFSSTCSVYGAQGDEPVNESSSLHPVTAYACSKLRAENDLLDLAGSGFTVTILRTATVYGVSPRLRFDLVMNNLAAWAVATGQVFLKSDGSAWRPVVHVEDMCRAFLAVMEAPADLVHRQIFNVGRPEENYRVKSLAEMIGDSVPGSRIVFSPGACRDERCYFVECNKLPQMLSHYQPVWTARAGARQLVDFMQTHGVSVADVEGPRFKRVDHIRQHIQEGRLDPGLRWRMSNGHG